MNFRRLSHASVLAVLLSISAGALSQEVSTHFPGDEFWEQRADGASGARARPGPMDSAIAAYRKGIGERPQSLEPRWRLMRALYFKGEYTGLTAEEQKRIFDEGKTAGEEALALIRTALTSKTGKKLEKASPVELAPLAGKDRDTALCFLWAGVDWGKWSLAYGKSAAVKQGAAAKIRDYAKAVIMMDPALDDAGGYRVLGRLHHQTPSVPFFTGWASRDEALSNLRLAVKTAPKSFINQLYLADAIWDYEKKNRAEAKTMITQLMASKPSPAFLVEDLFAQEEARALLDRWNKE